MSGMLRGGCIPKLVKVDEKFRSQSGPQIDRCRVISYSVPCWILYAKLDFILEIWGKAQHESTHCRKSDLDENSGGEIPPVAESHGSN